jgi:hypothetical protein
MSRPLRVLFVSGSPGAATLRYRVRLAEEALRTAGIETAAVHHRAPHLQSWAAGADVVTVYRCGASERVLRMLESCAEQGIATSYDIDDRVFLPQHLDDIPFVSDLSPVDRMNFEVNSRSNGLMVPAVARTSSSTTPLAHELASLHSDGADATVLPNGVGLVTAAAAAATNRDRPRGARVRIGYFSGSATHDADWAQAEPALLEVFRTHPETELWLVGSVAVSPAWNAFGSRVTRIGPLPWTDLPELIAAIDINLAPLEVSPFTEAKSAIKWLEAALVGTPTVATATQPFRDAITDGAGVLVPAGGDWHAPVTALVEDAELRRRVGEEARAAAYRGFGPEVQSDRYAAFYRALAGAPADPDVVRAATAQARVTGPLVTGGHSELESYPYPDDLVDMTFGRSPGDAPDAGGPARGPARRRKR